MRKFVCLIILLIVSQVTLADYVLISGSNDTNTSSQSIIRYRDDFIAIWERSPATGTPEPYVNDIEISPLDPNLGGGDIYTAHYGFGAPTGLSARHYDAETGEFVGQVVPSAAGDGQYDGTGTYLPLIEGRSAVLQDIAFGYDYNGDGVQDLWAARRDWFEIYDGKTLNRTGEDGTADLLTFLDVPDSDTGRTGTGAFGFCFGLDVNGDGIGELFAMRGINASTGSRLNVWDPVNLSQVTTYNMDGVRDNSFMILGPDVNGDGAQDLWVGEARNNRLMAIDCATGTILLDEIPLVPADDPEGEFTIRYPNHVSLGPDGTVLVGTRFASSLDADWEGGGDIPGGDLLQVVWDAENQRGLVILLYEHTGRISGTVYIPIDKTKAHYPLPANNAVEVLRDTTLDWEAGITADTHNVYIGTDLDAVTAGSEDVLASQNQAGVSYDPPGLLDWGTAYYWRVDAVEADGTTIEGDIWSFTTVNFVVVEDFEDYNDFPPDEVWNTWIDGFGDSSNGSTAGYPEPDFVAGEHYLETSIFHGGKQSLPLFYNNAAGLSEVNRTLSGSLTDFTQDGVVTLTMWYYGNEENAAEPMYVALNGNAAVTNDDANAALVTEWTRWDVPLQEFADQGVNLSNVNSISLGFGNKANPVAGGEGHVFFDDIRLYRP